MIQGQTWAGLAELVELSCAAGRTTLPLTTGSPLAFCCWKKGDCSIFDAMVVVVVVVVVTAAAAS